MRQHRLRNIDAERRCLRVVAPQRQQSITQPAANIQHHGWLQLDDIKPLKHLRLDMAQQEISA